MRPKLTDVAKLAQVSPTTVSRVINQKGYLSEKTIQRVHEAMKELNYQPNNLARSLQGKKTKMIGVVFPSISNLFYAELIDHLERELYQAGYKMFFCNSDYEAQKEVDSIQMLLANQVDGMIVGSHSLTAKDYEKISAPIVSFDRYLGEAIPIVSCDNYAGGKMATKQLLTHGIKQIVMITGNNDKMSPTYERYRGYVDEMTSRQLAAQWFPLANIHFPEKKRQAIKQLLLSQPIEGVFCSDDMTAMLVMQVAEELGISIPENLKIIGFDGTPFVENYYPFLTTIKQPIAQIAEACVQLLLQQIEGKTVETKRYQYSVEVLRGKSC